MAPFISVGQFRRFAALPGDERERLLQAAIAVAVARLALLVLPFRWVCAQMEACKPEARQPGGRQAHEAPASRWAWAVRVAARRVPGASCLTQALALQWLLARAGQSVRIHLGVAKNGARGFEAHAWLESCGEILIGGDDSPDLFLPILALPRDAP